MYLMMAGEEMKRESEDMYGRQSVGEGDMNVIFTTTFIDIANMTIFRPTEPTKISSCFPH